MKTFLYLLTGFLVVSGADVAAKEKPDKTEKSERKESEKKEKAERREQADKSANPPSPKEPMAKSEGYDAFRNVRTKNIFDPSRRGPRIETPPTAGSTTSSRGRSLALTGTMVTEGKALAFFGGSAADGNRVISVGNSVASYKLTEIRATQVSLERDGKSIVLDVGRQITFEGAPGDPAAAGPIVEAAAHPGGETPGLPTLPASAGDKSEILRRMMERRAKEGGQ